MTLLCAAGALLLATVAFARRELAAEMRKLFAA